MREYFIRFIAVNADDLPLDAEERVDAAARAMPGIRVSGEVVADHDARRLETGFEIPVHQGMAEAARDGGRLAKEILLAARMPDARLVEMVVRMVDPAATGWTRSDGV